MINYIIITFVFEMEILETHTHTCLFFLNNYINIILETSVCFYFVKSCQNSEAHEAHEIVKTLLIFLLYEKFSIKLLFSSIYRVEIDICINEFFLSFHFHQEVLQMLLLRRNTEQKISLAESYIYANNNGMCNSNSIESVNKIYNIQLKSIA